MAAGSAADDFEVLRTDFWSASRTTTGDEVRVFIIVQWWVRVEIDQHFFY